MNYQEQIEVFKEERKKEIAQQSSKILAGKQKKLISEAPKDVIGENKKSLLEPEIEKIGILPRNQSLIQVFHAQPWNYENLLQVEDWTYTGRDTKRHVFHDLWHKGFFITDGVKFGGEFLEIGRAHV